MEPLRFCKKIYLPAPFVGLFLEQNLTPVKAWTHLHGDIVDGGQEVDYRPIIDWLRVALTKKVGVDKSPLAMPCPTTPLENSNVLHHNHHMLTQHLPWI